MAASAQLVGVLLRPYVADVLAGTPWLDDQILYHPRSKQSDERSLAVLRRMRACKFDSVVLFTNSFRTASLALASGAKQRIGYVRNGRGLLLTHRLYEPRQGWHRLPAPQIETYSQLVAAMGCPCIPNAWNSPRAMPMSGPPMRSGKSGTCQSGSKSSCSTAAEPMAPPSSGPPSTLPGLPAASCANKA